VRFEDYVTERGQGLLRLACVLTADPHRAEDLTQTVLEDAYRHWRRVTSARSPDAYVRRMMVNAHLDWHRRRSSTELPTDRAVERSGTEREPGEALAQRSVLRPLLATLAPRARTILVLRYYLDLDDAAIAQTMDISTSTVRATISRALVTLRSDGTVNANKEAP
jgi:RNA polymerase sigma-70 factor (sigma-E family)